jgi:hypothetical protein
MDMEMNSENIERIKELTKKEIEFLEKRVELLKELLKGLEEEE